MTLEIIKISNLTKKIFDIKAVFFFFFENVSFIIQSE